MTVSDFISYEEVIAEASSMIDDESNKKIGRGFLRMAAHRALEDLSLTGFFQTVTKDIFDWNVNDDLIMSMPSNSFNIKELYLFNCESESKKWLNSVEVHYKRTFNRFGSTTKASAKLTPSGNNSPIHDRHLNIPSNLYYFGTQGNLICFSDNCSTFKNVRLVYNGFGSEKDDLPIIPRYLRAACVWYCVERANFKLKSSNKQYRIDWLDAKAQLYGGGGFDGHWTIAKRNIRRLDSKSRDDLKAYFSNIENK